MRRARAALLLVTLLLPGGLRAEGMDRGPGYARTTWATVHGTGANDDWVPLTTGPGMRQAWHVLEGSASWTAPSVASNGTLFVTTGRGRGHAHLHAISPLGEIAWESPVAKGPDDLDSGAVTSAPVLDREGDVYVGDENQIWAFHPDGRLKWVTDTTALGAPGPFVTAILLKDAVGAVGVNGHVILLRLDSGELAAPVLELPGGPSPDGPGVPEWIWDGGLMDPETKVRTQEILLGHRYEVTNTPAVHPGTGRIYLLAGGRSLDEGLFYGIDLVDGELRIAFETPVDPGTGTSPAISPDGQRVYAFDGKGDVMAFDASSGAILFTAPAGAVQASPSVGPAGEVYALARERLLKLDGRSGAKIWERTYHDFAAAQLPTVSSWWPFVVTGEPVAAIDSVVTITNELIWTSLVLGWELEVFGNALMHTRSTFLVAIDPASGELLAHYPIPDTSEGGISVGPGGELYLDILAVQASLAAGAPYRWVLPGVMRTPAPKGGIVAFEPLGAAGAP